MALAFGTILHRKSLISVGFAWKNPVKIMDGFGSITALTDFLYENQF